ncbi:MAG: putative nucleic acid-binding Zn-ribbon protein, partial [Gammaproteobacteria bacterium]
AAVALAGLMTGAKEARAATRSLENAQERESMLMEQLRNIRSERNEVREELKALQLTIRR